MSALSSFFAERQSQAADLLRQLVEIESPTQDHSAVNRMAGQIAQEILALDGRVTRLPGAKAGDMILGRWPGRKTGKGILILCHMDTVWPVGTLAQRPVQIREGRLYGPGAYDMKAGLVISLEAISGLRSLGLLPALPVTLLCTADEENGSRESRPTIEAQAAQNSLVLCMEPALPGGVLKTSRKGVGEFTITVHGRAAHAGADHQKGINAIEEMAHQVLDIQALTRYEVGTTVNVGVIRGGSVSNVVPAECVLEVDFRVESVPETERILQAITQLKPHLPGAVLEIEGELNRPPMVRDAQMKRTFQRAAEIAHGHGLVLQEGSTGGASDANFTASMGIATLDGLGADGNGAHSTDEHVILSSLPERSTLLAALLRDWGSP